MIDFVAAGFELTGLYAVGNKRRYGFLLNVAGDIAWIYLGLITKLYGLVGIAGVALILNIRNFLRWQKRDNDATAELYQAYKWIGYAPFELSDDKNECFACHAYLPSQLHKSNCWMKAVRDTAEAAKETL